MKSYVILGIIALVMLVLAVPVMADTTTATMGATGTITQKLSIENNAQSVDFGAFVQGINEKDSVGTLTITSAFIPTWKVTATMSDGYGFMRSTSPTTANLQKPLQEYNYISGAGWQNAHGMTFSGSASTTMLESFQQEVLINDQQGSYSTTITYTIAAV